MILEGVGLPPLLGQLQVLDLPVSAKITTSQSQNFDL
jgi:hypothetical protein